MSLSTGMVYRPSESSSSQGSKAKVGAWLGMQQLSEDRSRRDGTVSGILLLPNKQSVSYICRKVSKKQVRDVGCSD